jgi:hypothetical protein
MVKTACTLLGLGFLAVGALGFLVPDLLGAHLGPAHNAVHLLSGALALGFGVKGTREAARGFALAFGTLYFLLGVAGFVLGAPGSSTVAHAAHDDRLLRVLPGTLELGTVDHAIHVVLGLAFVVAALATVRVTAPLAPRPPGRGSPPPEVPPGAYLPPTP